MASEEESMKIVAPPSPGPDREGDEREDETQLERDGGLLSTTPSSVPLQGPLSGQLDQLMTIIQTFRRENNDLRNQLSDQNLVIQHKTRNLQQINDNYKEYDDMVKKKYAETAEKFKAIREENVKLKEDIEKLNSEKDGDVEVTGENTSRQDEEETSLRSWITINVEKEQGQTASSSADYRKLKNQLNVVQEKATVLAEELQKAKELKGTCETKLKSAVFEIAKNKDERKKENQELRATLGAEVNGYKQQVQTLLADLAESKRNLALHARKVKELHDANLQFDQVNSAYHNKIAMYVDELQKRDGYIEQLKQQHQQVVQRISNEKLEMQELEKKYDRVQETLRVANKQGFEGRRERDSLTARVVSMEESLEAREIKLKAAADSIQLLQAQLKQYREDFDGERLAREQIHHRLQEKELEADNLKKECEKLQLIVNKYAQVQMQRLSSQYQPTSTPTSPLTPPSPMQYRPQDFGLYQGGGGTGRGMGYGFDQHHGEGYRGEVQPLTTEENEHKCPMCGECFAESDSLRIHCNSHFPED